MADINLGVGGANSAVAGGYDIANSVKLEPDNSEYFNKTFGSAGNRKTWSYSCWIKKTELFSSNGGALISAYPDVNNRLKIAFSQHKIQVFGKVSGSTTVNVRTNRLYRDTSAFYHILVVFDTTQGTAANRVKIYTNGVLEDSFDQTTYPSQNNDEEIGNSSAHYIGQRGDGSSDFYAGYITEINYVNGQALAPTDFGEFDEDTGIWKPKAYTGSYGTNGFYLDFESSGSLGADSSGNGNNFTLNNITSANQATDTPTNNFCTFNPLMIQNHQPTISEGAMKSTGVADNWSQTWGNIGVKKGKWYYEFKVANTSSTGYFGASTTPAEGSSTAAGTVMYNTSFMLGQSPRIDYYSWQNGSLAANESTGWGTISTNDVIGIALDLDSATKTFTAYKNGTALSGTLSQPVALPTNMQDEFIFPLYVQYKDRQDEANFGGYTISSISTPASDENGYGTFEYAPPSGYYALCTKNLAEYG